MDISGLNKGDEVRVTAICYTKEKPPHICGEEEIVREVPPKCNGIHDFARPLVKIKVESFMAVVIGYTFRISGTYHEQYKIDPYGDEEVGNDEVVEQNGWIEDAVWHKVLLVEPTNTQRWVQPFTALEEDCHRVTLAKASMAHVITKQQKEIDKLNQLMSALPDPGDHDS